MGRERNEMVGEEMTLRVHDFLTASATARPDAPAIVLTDRTWTYAELAQASGRVAAWLVDRGLRRGDRAVMLFKNGLMNRTSP